MISIATRVINSNGNLRRLIVDALVEADAVGGPPAVEAAAIEAIRGVMTILAHECGHRHALDVLDMVRRLHDPRSPDHWQRQKSLGGDTR